MADGDAMILATLWNGDLATQSNFDSLLVNGPLEDWPDANDLATGWAYSSGWTETRQAGNRTGGVGGFYQRLVRGSPSTSVWEQFIDLRGHAALDALGHMGREFTAEIWVRDQGAGSVDMSFRMFTYRSNGITLLQSGAITSATPVPSSWTKYTATITINDATAAKIKFHVTFNNQSGAQQIEIDECALYRTYTFDRNPSVPDNQPLAIPHREYRRNSAGDLLMGRPSGSTGKYEKRLRFGLVGLTQLKELRSIALLDKPVHLTPFHPHFPEFFQARIVGDFNFRLVPGGSFAGNHYAGDLILSEL